MKKMNGKVLEVEQEVSGGRMLTRVCDIRVALRRWEERRGLRSGMIGATRGGLSI